MKIKEMEQKIRDKSNNIITDLSKDQIEQYIQVLTKNYYEYYLSGNSKKFHENFKELKNLIKLTELDYPNIRNYTNYCLLCNINKILEDNLKINMDLIIFEGSIDENEHFKINMEDERIFERDLELLKNIIADGND